ncbi:tRNA-uridine aminocarboxypropyltransferase [Colwellia psychrerythraea]|uniref:tRNA-uridine aminocarboxypropyltransferase n=1 Tax=Colwellia psychrerythraea TaxID=28229 RepID=A0A099KIN0_COLPS|nr:tRNA-uridine aminocarboxypropyltransferase [Colwellia psychrerythraea]KGJ89857.1 DTW domain containing protein [Colwellia psychrerythraea]
MSRIFCPNCNRPENACICAFTADIANDIHVVVLQHPSEVSHTKGTVALLAKSLRKCQVIVGESFDSDNCFSKVLTKYQPVLLYPGQQANILNNNSLATLINLEFTIDEVNEKSKPLCLVILDGTWKKAYRMFMLSTKLQQLSQVCLPEYLANAGQYQIRKVAKKNALSSLEASCYALALLEHNDLLAPDGSADFHINTNKVSPENAGKYQPLLEKFKQFNQFQLSFRPEHKTL